MKKEFSKKEKHILLNFARSVIAREMGLQKTESDQKVDQIPLEILNEKKGVFITLRKQGELRGCIGNIEPYNTLKESIESNARHAAFMDPRFPPLNKDEFENIHIEISLLTKPQILKYSNPNELVSKLKPHIDGVILKKKGYQSTFLPQVWKHFSNPESFLEHLCIKAGLEPDSWKNQNLEILTYQVESFEEE